MGLKLLVGLGNPDSKYLMTRHNAGFILLDLLAMAAGSTWQSGKFKNEEARARICGESCLLVKPLAYYNRSGEVAGNVARYYKVEPVDTIVIHDDIDVPFGKVKAKAAGGHGGNNGVRDMITHFGTDAFHRIKVGVGRPEDGRDPADWVLSDFRGEELETLRDEMLPEVERRLEQIFKKLS